jgi:hypothetical protein
MIPFTLVTYFLMSAIFLQDFKSLIFLGGLLLACGLAMFLGDTVKGSIIFPFVPNFAKYGLPNSRSVCHTIPLFDSGPASRLPLSTVVYIYTLCYFSIPILHYERHQTNLPILIAFPLLAFLDMAWLYLYGCASAMNIFGAGLVGMVVGLFWSEIIFISNLRQVQYFGILSNNELCALPSRISYRCKNSPPMTSNDTFVDAETGYSSSYYHLSTPSSTTSAPP